MRAARSRSASATFFIGQPYSVSPGTDPRSVTLPSVIARCPNPILWSRVNRPPSRTSVLDAQSIFWIAPWSTFTPRQNCRSGMTTSDGLSDEPATSASIGWNTNMLRSATSATRRTPSARPNALPSARAQ